MEVEDENENQVENAHMTTWTNKNYEYIPEDTDAVFRRTGTSVLVNGFFFQKNYLFGI